MNGMAFLRCLSLAVALAAGAGLRADNTRKEEKMKPLDHQKTPLPENPPIRFKKVFAIEQQHEGQGFGLLEFSPDGTTLAASRWGGHRNHDVTLWDVQKRSLRHILPHTENTADMIGAIAFVPPGDRLVTACLNLNKVFLWDVRSGNLLDTLDTSGKPDYSINSITGLAAFPDGKRVIICARTGLTVWDLEAKTHHTLPLDEHVPLAPGEKRAIPRFCSRVAFTADGSRFATSVRDTRFAPRILLWDANTSRVTGMIPTGIGNFHFAYAPDGSSIAADQYAPQGGQGSLVNVWDPATQKKILSGSIFGSLFDFVYTRDGKYLLVAGKHMPQGTPTDDPVIGVWDVASGKVVNCVKPVGIGPIHLAVSPDNKLLAVPRRNIDVYAIEYARQSQGSPKAPPRPKP